MLSREQLRLGLGLRVTVKYRVNIKVEGKGLTSEAGRKVLTLRSESLAHVRHEQRELLRSVSVGHQHRQGRAAGLRFPGPSPGPACHAGKCVGQPYTRQQAATYNVGHEHAGGQSKAPEPLRQLMEPTLKHAHCSQMS